MSILKKPKESDFLPPSLHLIFIFREILENKKVSLSKAPF